MKQFKLPNIVINVRFVYSGKEVVIVLPSETSMAKSSNVEHRLFSYGMKNKESIN
jgi:hypothetical protein